MSVMQSMVEKAALSIYSRPTSIDGDQIAVHLGNSMIVEMASRDAEEQRDLVMGICLDAARAAIEAMSDPTDAMVDAFGAIFHTDWHQISDDPLYRKHAREGIRAAIDAALNEQVAG